MARSKQWRKMKFLGKGEGDRKEKEEGGKKEWRGKKATETNTKQAVDEEEKLFFTLPQRPPYSILFI